MSDTFFIEGLNTLPEQVQLNKEDIKKLSDSSNAQIQALTTKVDTNTASIVTNANDIDNLSKKVYDNGTLSFQIEKEDSKNCFTFKDNTINTWFKIISKYNNYDWSIHTNSNIIYFYTNITIFDTLKCDGLKLRTGLEVNYIDSSFNDADNVLLTAGAIDNNYLKKTDAYNTYVSKEDYDKRFDIVAISLTAQGLNKIKALTDNPNQVIELHIPVDCLEIVQQPSGKDLKLQIIYNGSPLYENIVLHSNRTIGDYNNISSSSPKTIWYTGQAIITLASQSDGLFDIAYQYGNLLGLHLITTF